MPVRESITHLSGARQLKLYIDKGRIERDRDVLLINELVEVVLYDFKFEDGAQMSSATGILVRQPHGHFGGFHGRYGSSLDREELEALGVDGFKLEFEATGIRFLDSESKAFVGQDAANMISLKIVRTAAR